MSEPSHREGYVTDVLYPRAFTSAIAPSTLRLVAALNGYPPPPEEGFDYCELGSATGDTLSTLAASNPDARFVGIDLSARHVEKATERAVGLENVRFILADFEDFLGKRTDLGPQRTGGFDFIVAHGLWSWIPPRKREALLAFVRTYLKPGGLFYLSYNALPGWASVLPLRRLLLSQAKGASTLDRAREGVAFLQRLADSGAGYFAAHPVAKTMLGLMQKGGPAYVAHEYFHEHWEPMSFADVAGALRESDLGFLGQVPLYLNVRELAIPPAIKKAAESVQDRVALETLKDFANNELFRSDVYVQGARGSRGKVTREVSQTQYYFEGTPFGTLAPLANVRREAKLPSYTVDYRGPVYERILSRIAAEPATAMTLGMTPELAQLGQIRIGDALQALVLGGQVVPMPGAGAGAGVGRSAKTGEGGTYKVAHPYNRLVLEEALREEGPSVLASPVTRGGVHVSLLEALAIHVLTSGSDVRAYAASRPMPMVVGDRRIKDADELVKVMARELPRFQSESLGKLVELGILA